MLRNGGIGARSPPRAERRAGPIALAGKVPGEAMPGIGLLRRLRIRLSPVDRAAVTMNRGRGAGSRETFTLSSPFSWTPLTPPLPELTIKTIAFVGTRLFTFPLVPMRGSRPIPPELGNLAKVESLSFAGNHLTGEIPPELGNLANLESLNFAGNQLSGCVPGSLQDQLELESTYLGDLEFC